MEQRTREKVSKAVSDILKSAGFDVHHASPPLDMSAIRNTTYLLVMCTDDPDEAFKYSETEYTIRVGQEEEICDKLLVTFNPSIHSDNCIVWYPEEFALYAGEAVLARVLGKTLLLPLDGSEDPSPYTVKNVPESDGGVRIPHLPLRIHRDEAEEKAGIPGVATLRFIPYWLFRYTCRGDAAYKDQNINFDCSGSGAVNAINSAFTDIDADSVTRREIPKGSDISKPTISHEDAEKIILDHLIQSMTKRVRLRQVKGDAIFYEEKNLSPDRENFSLELRELYIPVWQIKGKKIVEINANSGQKLVEPLDDGVEVL
ncbi:MAG: hypothetical protein GXY48_12765 [Methanomicrobiales archaeon]|nr:hypothetical protein [Methanomicrobiales archaeon]